jgi:hypothetical protein
VSENKTDANTGRMIRYIFIVQVRISLISGSLNGFVVVASVPNRGSLKRVLHCGRESLKRIGSRGGVQPLESFSWRIVNEVQQPS